MKVAALQLIQESIKPNSRTLFYTTVDDGIDSVYDYNWDVIPDKEVVVINYDKTQQVYLDANSIVRVEVTEIE